MYSMTSINMKLRLNCSSLCLSCEAAQIPSLISSSLSVMTGKVRLDPSWFGSGCN